MKKFTHLAAHFGSKFISAFLIDPRVNRDKVGHKGRNVTLENRRVAFKDMLVHYVNGIKLRNDCKIYLKEGKKCN